MLNLYTEDNPVAKTQNRTFENEIKNVQINKSVLQQEVLISRQLFQEEPLKTSLVASFTLNKCY